MSETAIETFVPFVATIFGSTFASWNDPDPATDGKSMCCAGYEVADE